GPTVQVEPVVFVGVVVEVVEGPAGAAQPDVPGGLGGAQVLGGVEPLFGALHDHLGLAGLLGDEVVEKAPLVVAAGRGSADAERGEGGFFEGPIGTVEVHLLGGPLPGFLHGFATSLVASRQARRDDLREQHLHQRVAGDDVLDGEEPSLNALHVFVEDGDGGVGVLADAPHDAGDGAVGGLEGAAGYLHHDASPTGG